MTTGPCIRGLAKLLATNSGRYVARLHNGWIRDSGGNAIAFTDGASGGPLPPMRSIPSIKSVPSIPPI
ncbi:4-fold beta flower protein [Bradyrhizobium barranii]|uniref:4-fold beta flower protein n=1 Tax=Bradyrhizobium barranii TaxID=2992140 RepID=UPI003BB95631